MPTSSGRRTLILCRDCGKQSEHQAHGRCSVCYQRHRRVTEPERTRESQRKSYAKHKEERSAQKKEYYAANRERLLARQKERDLAHLAEKRQYNRAYQTQHPNPEYHRHYKLKRLYGLTPEAYDEMHAAQMGVCAICAQEETAKSRNGKAVLKVDHDHTTGAVRGLLCHRCNTALAHIERDGWLDRALAYLKREPLNTSAPQS